MSKKLVHLIVIEFHDETIMHLFGVHNTRDWLLEELHKGWAECGGVKGTEPFGATDLMIPQGASRQELSRAMILFGALALHTPQLTLIYGDSCI